MHGIRQKFYKWWLRRFLHRARAGLARDPSPARIRHDLALFDRMMQGRERFLMGPTVAVGGGTGAWLDAGGSDEGRVVLYFHGGAFVGASPAAHCGFLARLCRGAGGRGFYVDYRLAPEHPYPSARDDCLDAYRHLLDAGIHPGRIVIAGDSAGGNLTAVTAMRIRDLGLPAPAALVMISPVLDLTFSGDSIRRNDGIDPLFRACVADSLAPVYLPGGDVRDPYVSPLCGNVSGLPPSLLVVGSSEILLDDSTRFASRADDAELLVWHDMPHIFPILDRLDEAVAAVEAMARFIRARAAGVAAKTGTTSASG